MNDTKCKVIDGITDTVEELIELLKKVPKDYAASLSGINTFAILMDTENHTILMDDVNFVEELLEEQEREEKEEI